MNTCIKTFCFATLLGLCSAGVVQAAELAVKKTLTLEVAKALAGKASAFAKTNGWNVIVTIVDDGAHLLYFERMDGVQLGSINVALAKARTAALYKRPTKVFEDQIKGGRPELLGLPDALAVEGGVPIDYEGVIIGAIGVSGGTPQQDGLIGKAATDALTQILAQ